MNLEPIIQQAQNENTAPEILAELANHKDREIRQYVAKNPNTPTEVLLNLGVEFPKELLDNPIFNLLILEDIDFANKIPLPTLNSILREPNVPEFIIEQTCDRVDRDIQLALANNIITSKKILQKLASSINPDVVDSATLHINIAGELEEKFLDKGQKYIRNNFLSLIKKYARNGIVFDLIELTRLSCFPLYIIDIFYSEDRILYGYKKTLLAITNSSATCSSVLDYIAQKNTIKLQELIDNSVRWSTGNMSTYTINTNIAQNPSTPSKILNLFLDKDWDWLNQAIANNPKVPENLLTQLVNKEERKIRDAVAKNINCPIDILVKLAQDKDKRIAEFASVKLAIEHNCYDYVKKIKITEMVLGKSGNSLRTVDELNLSQEQQIVSRVIKDFGNHLNITPNTLTKIAERYPLCVARNPQTPQDLLCELSQHKKDNVRLAIAQNSSTPEYILGQLAYDSCPAVAASLVKNPNTPLHIIFQPLANRSAIIKNVLYSTTSNQSKSREIINSILSKENYTNFDLERVLELLIEYGEERTRIFLAKKKHLPHKFFQQLAKTDELMVQRSLAENPHTPSDVLENLANNPNSKTYQRIAINPNTSNNVLEDLASYNLDPYARSQEQIVSYIALLQPEVSQTILLEQSGSVTWLNRFAVAQNPTTSFEILERLTEDCNQLVRAAAKENLEKRK